MADAASTNPGGPSTPPPAPRGTPLGRIFAGLPGGHLGLVALLILLLILFTWLVPGFLGRATLMSFMYQLPLLGLLSLAMIVPLLTGGLNLAIIATTNQAALLMVWIMSSMAPDGSGGGTVALATIVAMGAALLLCILIGVFTGALVAYTGVHPILVTLGTKSLIDGISIYLTRGRALSGLPESFSSAVNATVLGVPMIFVLLLVVALILGIILRHSPFGVACAMIGSNIEATRYSSIDTRRTLVGVYTLSSVVCFFAALVMLASFNSASADYAQSYLLVTILAAVLGGVDAFGGFGTVSGLMIALAILQVISTGMNLLGISTYMIVAIWGGVLIGVVVAQTAWQYVSPLARRGK